MEIQYNESNKLPINDANGDAMGTLEIKSSPNGHYAADFKTTGDRSIMTKQPSTESIVSAQYTPDGARGHFMRKLAETGVFAPFGEMMQRNVNPDIFTGTTVAQEKRSGFQIKDISFELRSQPITAGELLAQENHNPAIVDVATEIVESLRPRQDEFDFSYILKEMQATLAPMIRDIYSTIQLAASQGKEIDLEFIKETYEKTKNTLTFDGYQITWGSHPNYPVVAGRAEEVGYLVPLADQLEKYSQPIYDETIREQVIPAIDLVNIWANKVAKDKPRNAAEIQANARKFTRILEAISWDWEKMLPAARAIDPLFGLSEKDLYLIAHRELESDLAKMQHLQPNTQVGNIIVIDQRNHVSDYSTRVSDTQPIKTQQSVYLNIYGRTILLGRTEGSMTDIEAEMGKDEAYWREVRNRVLHTYSGGLPGQNS
jgi:hypothetical protein